MKHLLELTEKYKFIAEYINEAQTGQIINLNVLCKMNSTWDKKEVQQWIKASKQPLSSFGYGMYRKLSDEDLDFIKSMSSLSVSDSADSDPMPAEQKSAPSSLSANSLRFHATPLLPLDPMCSHVWQPLRRRSLDKN